VVPFPFPASLFPPQGFSAVHLFLHFTPHRLVFFPLPGTFFPRICPIRLSEDQLWRRMGAFPFSANVLRYLCTYPPFSLAGTGPALFSNNEAVFLVRIFSGYSHLTRRLDPPQIIIPELLTIAFP